MKAVKDVFGGFRAPGLDVGMTAFHGGVKRRQPPLPFLDQTQAVAHHFAGVVITPIVDKAFDKTLEMLAQTDARTHESLTCVIRYYSAPVQNANANGR